MELVNGSLLLSMIVYSLFGFCVAGGFFGVIGTGYRVWNWYMERHLKYGSQAEYYREAAVVWAGLTIATWTLAVCIDIYII